MLHSFQSSDIEIRDIYDSTKGIFFFGTPHQGLDVCDLKEMLDVQAKNQIDNYERPQLLDQLNIDSEFLESLKESSARMWGQFSGRICSFYETEDTETVQIVGLPSY